MVNCLVVSKKRQRRASVFLLATVSKMTGALILVPRHKKKNVKLTPSY